MAPKHFELGLEKQIEVWKGAFGKSTAASYITTRVRQLTNIDVNYNYDDFGPMFDIELQRTLGMYGKQTTAILNDEVFNMFELQIKRIAANETHRVRYEQLLHNGVRVPVMEHPSCEEVSARGNVDSGMSSMLNIGTNEAKRYIDALYD